MGRFIVTGANRGIGFYMVQRLLQDGHRASVLDICTDGLEELKQQFGERLLAYPCDVGSAEETAEAVALAARDMGGIDYACHNACICTFESMEGPYTFGTYLWAKFDNLSNWERKLIEGPYIHHMAEIEGDWTEELREFCKYVPGLLPDMVEK